MKSWCGSAHLTSSNYSLNTQISPILLLVKHFTATSPALFKCFKVAQSVNSVKCIDWFV